jgi:hypothetical protein
VSERRNFDNWNLWFDWGKKVELRLWDITATTNINQGLEPGITDEKTHVVPLSTGVKNVDIEATFLFEHEPGHWEPIKTVTKTVDFESAEKYFKK